MNYIQYKHMLDILPSDIIKLILSIVTPSTYICLIKTSKAFHQIKRTFDKHKIIEDALSHDQPTIFIYLKTLGFTYTKNKIATIVSRYGHIDMLTWCIKNNYKIVTDECIREAAKNRHIAMLKYLAKVTGLHVKLSELAAEHGLIEIIKYCYDNNYDHNKKGLCGIAAKHGQLETLKWLYEHSYAWTCTTINNAAQFGHLEVLKYAYEHGCPLDHSYRYAVAYGQIHILDYLFEQDCKWHSNEDYVAAQNGELEALKWLYNHGYPINKYACYDAVRFNVKITDWLDTI